VFFSFSLESTSLEWRPKTGLVRYTAPASNGGQGVDRLALGLITPQVDAVLLRLDYTKEPTRFLELSIVSQQNTEKFIAYSTVLYVSIHAFPTSMIHISNS
jgi:hypothetical protein